MKQRFKKLILAMMLAISLPSFAHDFEVDGIYYYILSSTNKTVSVTYRGSSYDSYDNEYTGSVTIPETVTYSGTTYSVTTIGKYAFCYCSGLTSVTIPNSVTEIGYYAFLYCSDLKSVTIPNSVTEIGIYAFRDCSGLTSVTIGNSVTSIGDSAFYGCSGLTSVTIPNSVTSIGDEAFYKCSGMTEVNYNAENCTSMGSNNHPVFRDCTNLKSVNIGNSVKTIPDCAFYGCSGLTSVTIGNSVCRIGLCAFMDCSGLTSIEIPNSVTEIFNNAFSGCSGLTEVNITDLYAWCKIDFDVINANPLQFAYHLKLNGTEITDLVIPDGITEIKNQAFGLCIGLTSVTIPNSVTSIGELSFALCSGLTEVTIGNSVTSIGDYAFKDCSALTSITSHIPADKLFALDSSVLNATIKENCTLYVPFGTKETYSATDGWSEFTNIEELEEQKKCGVNAYWSFNEETGVLTISGTGAMYDYLSGGTPWYNNRSDIKSVEIGNSITSIGDYAFEDCSGLTEVTIGNSVTSIGNSAFRYCRGLTEVNYNAENCTSMGLDYSPVFKDCANLKSVNIGNSVKTIPNYAFYGCSGLTSVTIPNSVTSIGKYAFCDCSGLTSVTIGNSVTSIGDYAFEDCSGLTSVTIPNSVTSIGNSAFRYCRGLTDLIIEDGTETLSLGYNGSSEGLFSDSPIEKLYLGRNLRYSTDYYYGYSPFYENTTLKKVTIGNSVTSIGDYAFYKCSGMTEVTIGNSVTKIGEFAFEDCRGLTEVNITDLSAWCKIYFYYSGSNPLSYADHLKLNGTEITDLIIPDGITEIKSFAFEGCSGLTSVTIPNSVTSIGSWAFSGCSGLTSIEIPNSVTEIFNNAFDGCRGLTEVTIPNSVTEIGDLAFYYCSGLTGDLVIPNSVTEIGGWAFRNCSGLTELIIEDGTETLSFGNECFKGSPLEKLYLGRNTTNYPFTYITTLKEITIGNCVTEIGSFEGCSGLKSVTIPNSVTSIGGGAFSGCSGLTDLIIEDGTEPLSLGSLFSDCPLEKLYLGRNLSYNTSNSPFSNKTTLKEVIIGNSVASIDSYVFYGCSGLTSIEIPNSVTEIGDWAFSGCSGLTEVTIPNSVTSIGRNAFYNTGWYNKQSDGILYLDNCCLGYKGDQPIGKLPLNEGTRLIGDYAFFGCGGLISVTIPNSVTSIGNYAFNGCGKLMDVEYNAKNLLKVGVSTNLSYAKIIIVGEDVETITAGIIDSSNATTIISKNTTPPVCDTNAFSSVNKSKCTLYVSVASLVDYWSADVWKEFTNIKQFIETTSITFDAENYKIKAGESLQINANISPSEASIADLIWTSSNPEVAMVSETGVVDGIQPGEATITVRTIDGSNLEASCKVTVETVLAESIALSQTEVELAPYESVVLTYTILPENTTNKSVTWSSSDESIATFKVNNDGSATVLILKDDKAVITVTTNDGSNLSASCVVGKTSGVEGVIVGGASVTVENGEIVVKNANGIVTVYNLAGVAIATETADGNEVRFDNLQSGIYVVVADGNAIKVKI